MLYIIFTGLCSLIGIIIINYSIQVKDFKNICNSIPTNKKRGKLYRLRKIFILIFETIKIKILQKINCNTNIIMIDKSSYIISYIINRKIYRMLVYIDNNPVTILQISNEEDDDITDKIIQYLRPFIDFRKTTFTPEFFGCTSLTFQMSTGEEIVFKNKEIINLI